MELNPDVYAPQKQNVDYIPDFKYILHAHNYKNRNNGPIHNNRNICYNEMSQRLLL